MPMRRRDGFKGVLALEDIEDAFPLLRRLGLWAMYSELGAGNDYDTYRKCQYGDEGGGANPVKNVMVVKGKVRMGGGMEDGTFQGSTHSTKDRVLPARGAIVMLALQRFCERKCFAVVVLCN